MSDCVPDHLGATVESDGRDELELAEILWQKGPVLRRLESPPNITEEEDPLELFMGEDELASWLHQDDNYNNTNGRTPPNATTSGFDQTPNINPSVAEAEAEAEEGCASAAPPLLVDSTPVVAESSCNPALRWIPHNSGACSGSSGGSSDRGAVRERDHRKRKSRQLEQSDDEAAEHDSFEKRKDAPKPPRRTRTAEVHNLSERRRRDRINEKMKALQQLIPRCSKTDKASMLDDAVEYLKSLQLQVQMMSMGCTMPAMTFPPFGQTPQMGMFMGMGAEPNASHMGCPMLPFPPWMQASPAAGTSAAAAAHLGAGMPMQPFHPAAMFVNPQLAARQAGQLPDSMSNVFPMQGQNPQLMNMSGHPFNYFGLQQMQQQQHMNQVAMQDKRFCKSSSEHHT